MWTKNITVQNEIRTEFIRNMKRFHSPRIKESLKRRGIKIGHQKVAEIMQKKGLEAIKPPRFILRTTDGKRGKRARRNLLLDQANPHSPNAVWTSDITYLP